MYSHVERKRGKEKKNGIKLRYFLTRWFVSEYCDIFRFYCCLDQVFPGEIKIRRSRNREVAYWLYQRGNFLINFFTNSPIF